MLIPARLFHTTTSSFALCLSAMEAGIVDTFDAFHLQIAYCKFKRPPPSPGEGKFNPLTTTLKTSGWAPLCFLCAYDPYVVQNNRRWMSLGFQRQKEFFFREVFFPF